MQVHNVVAYSSNRLATIKKDGFLILLSFHCQLPSLSVLTLGLIHDNYINVQPTSACTIKSSYL